MLNEQYDSFLSVIDGEWAPTEGQRQVFAYLHSELAGELAKWHTIETTDIPALDRLMHENGVPSIGEAGGN